MNQIQWRVASTAGHDHGPAATDGSCHSAARPSGSQANPASQAKSAVETTDDFSGDCLLEVLACLGFGGIIQSFLGDFVSANRIALEKLAPVAGPSESDRAVRSPKTIHSLLKAPLRSLRDGTPWVSVGRPTGQPLIIGKLPMKLPGDCTLLILIDTGSSPGPDPGALAAIFGLTRAEAALAAALANGTSPTALASEFGVSRTTVRTHLASIFSKTQTRGQTELVALLCRIVTLQ